MILPGLKRRLVDWNQASKCGGRLARMNEQEAVGNLYEEIIQTLPGRILPKRYRVDRLLSANPYTALYRTFYEPEEKIVNLRVFRVLIRSEEDYQYKRFKQDVKKLMALSHPNIGKVLDYGLLDDGLPYIVLENLVGPTLEEVLVAQNRLEADQVVLIFSQIARALNAAHQQGILHESLQPSRIVISETDDGDVIVRATGFGLLSLHNKLGVSLKTPSSRARFLGTAAYMSPEQCYEGAEVDGRSDIYSVGCMIYECLSGQVPFLANDDVAMNMHLEMEPTPITTIRKDLFIPRKLLAIMNKCMVKDFTRRYQFVKDLQADLETDRDPSERDQETALPEGLQRAEQRVKDTKEFPFKLVGIILGSIIGLVIVWYVGSYVATMTSRLADNATWQSKLDAGKSGLKDGHFEEAGQALKGALTEARKFPPPDMRLALTETELGAFDILSGRYNSALEELRDAFQIEQQSRNNEAEAAARTLELLSAAELKAGKMREAEDHAATSVKISEGLSGQKTLRLYNSYLQQFKVLIASKKLDAAKVALDKLKAAIGSADIMLSMEVISGKKQAEALLAQAQGKYDDAEKGLQDVLGDRQEKVGLGALPTVETMCLLGDLYAAQGKYQKATAVLQQAFNAKQKLLGDTSPVLAEMCAQLGGIAEASKNKAETEKQYRQALELAESSWGKGKVETLPYLDALAKLLRANKEISKAEVYEVEALEIRHPERKSKLGIQ